MHQTFSTHVHVCLRSVLGKAKALGYGIQSGKPLEILFKSQLCHQLVKPLL